MRMILLLLNRNPAVVLVLLLNQLLLRRLFKSLPFSKAWTQLPSNKACRTSFRSCKRRKCLLPEVLVLQPQFPQLLFQLRHHRPLLPFLRKQPQPPPLLRYVVFVASLLLSSSLFLSSSALTLVDSFFISFYCTYRTTPTLLRRALSTTNHSRLFL